MHLIIRATGAGAGMLSHLLAKNPNNLYDRTEKEARVRIAFTASSEEEAEAVIYVTPDPVELVKGDSSAHNDITQYINDREFVTGSLFCSYIRGALGTALNGKPKEAYLPWVTQPLQLELSFGPVASNLPDRTVEELFGALGYEVALERGDAEYTFALKARSSVRYIRLKGRQTVQTALQQLFVLMPALDDYKHYYISEDEVDKVRRYGAGWLEQHPQRTLILKRTLRFAGMIRQYEETAAKELQAAAPDGSGIAAGQLAAAEAASSASGASGALPEVQEAPKVRLNELRYEAIARTVGELDAKASIVDFGSGEGKLSARLSSVPGVREIRAVEPSATAQLRAMERFAKLEGRPGAVVPEPVTGSLFYFDESLCGRDVMILCEVIEHIDEHRLDRVIDTIFGQYAPKTLIVTTPNKDYNTVYGLEQEEIRHADHRFEWGREAFSAWCTRWTEAFQYTAEITGIGEDSAEYGYPTQMAVFTRGEHLQ
ncbi:methyltransferase type 12 [Paenibacillus sp. FSL R7-0273]|uniref:3' terminal RNA ribose 2'-O-methyltransferase Hen1 n=1 Tax=Paenibacillus sp. FSL R7-0273 TaxID=1536772 RepID=UPI0004F7F0F3|nr:3' terminal RNA ribose 2'-O-methyltransferase Hen1 [Paenibacillus sp. FSL R7-0273]AIQ45222.1 methyltransferase type 12 [Paenibacillus sp. FSL R7-0273]OMF86156.1 3' terminal RNA ribose 2'-O-methyltransferase Hen1 [Paenibacillus sp. FSL R7-0273]